MKILVSILNWNQEEKTLACLASVQHLNDERIEIAVTDNFSTSFNVQKLKEAHQEVKVFVNDSNVGFAQGHQQALDYAMTCGADFFWMLNNDVILSKATLNHLIKAFEVHGEALYGSVSTEPNGNLTKDEIWKIHLKNNRMVCSFSPFSIAELDTDETKKVANLVGYSLFIPISIIKKHGFIDSSFFLYFEETDYCLRLLKRGIQSYRVGSSKVTHEDKGSSSGHRKLTPVIEYYLFRNLYRLLIDHATGMLVMHYLISFSKKCLKDLIGNEPNFLLLYRFRILGIIHAFLGIKGKYYSPEDFIGYQE